MTTTENQTTQNLIADLLVALTDRFGSVDAGAAALAQYVAETKAEAQRMADDLEERNQRDEAERNEAAFGALVRDYQAARYQYETSQLGPATDKAWARMERLLAQAEKRGWGDKFIAELSR